MDTLAGSEVFLFEDFRLDRRGDGLSRRDDSGAFVPVAIGSRALDILDVLVARAGTVVSKDEIIAAVWPGTVVEESNLTVQISALRRVLDRGRPNGSCIQTVPGRGYRFVAALPRNPIAFLPEIVGNGEDRDQETQPISCHPTVARARRWPWRQIAALLVVFAMSGSAAGWIWDHRRFLSADTRPRLSMVVLPFANLGMDPDSKQFVDAITSDLTTDLSRIGHGFVVSRNTAFTYRNKSVDTKQIGRELGVRYIVEGGVRRSDNKVRVSVQLIDAETDALFWAQQFDGDVGDLFALQDDITRRIAIALGIELVGREAARPTQHPDALDYILRGTAALNKPPSRERRVEQISLFERALALDPLSVEAQARVAALLAGRVGDNMTDTAATDMARAEDLAGRALTASPRSHLAHYARGQVLRMQRRFAEAIPEYEAVLAFNRNFVFALYALGQCKLFTGSTEDTIPLVEQAIRASPRDPTLGNWYQLIGQVHLLQSRTEEAIIWFERARSAIPTHASIRAHLASAYALDGKTERAFTELAEARRLSSDDRYTSLARLQALVGYWGVPKVQALFEGTYFTGLRRAGVPEE
jgi:TolB-like protein/DNA-binding winged helix-turn-helix (wHTH) protein